MEVKILFKTEEGYVKFEGNLSPEEHDYALGYGLNLLMRQGALKGPTETEEGDGYAAPEGTTVQ